MTNPDSFPCPKCGCPNEQLHFYNTNPDKTKGRYNCPQCGRDSAWAVGKSESPLDVINKILNQTNQKPN